MKCLLIDDNKDITDAISFFLETEDVPCLVKNDGREGLKAIKEGDHDLILLDLAMPDFSGHDIISSLNKENLMSEKKVVVVTASSMSDSALDNLLKMGVREILKKPVSMEILQKTIKKYGKTSD